MRKCFLLLPLVATSLSGCIFSDDDSWKKEYGTPELFFRRILEDNYQPRIYLYENTDQTIDETRAIATFLSNAGPFEETTKKADTVERYFTYEAYWQAATSGPNYCNMSLWDDGYLVINHKRSLGRLQSVYFSMDVKKASQAVTFAFTKVEQSKYSTSSSYLSIFS